MLNLISGPRSSRLMFAILAVLLSGDALALPEASVFVKAPRHAPIIIREQHDRNVSSSNWSGYTVVGAAGSVTDAKASWIVPAIEGTCPSENQYSSFWVGIDGFNSNTVEQLGTDSDCQHGAPVYYAWVEVFPHPSFIIKSVPVSPGDVISAEVSASGKRFTLSMTNETTGKSFSMSVRVARARLSSAEWIAEAPSSASGVLPLADFGTVSFGADATGIADTCNATVNGSTGSVGSFGPSVREITMTTHGGATKAMPSALSRDGSSFSVDWVSAGP